MADPHDLGQALPAGLSAASLGSHVLLAEGTVLLALADGELRALRRDAPTGAFSPIALGGRPSLEGDQLTIYQAVEAPLRISLDWLEAEVVADLLHETSSEVAWARAAHIALLRKLRDPSRLLVQLLLDRLRAPSSGSPSMSLDIARIRQELGAATTAEILQLVTLLRADWSVPESVASTPSATGRFSVAITHPGGNKIAVIKAVRELTNLDLRDAKSLVERGGTIVDGAPSAEAEHAKELLERAGAHVSVLPVG